MTDTTIISGKDFAKGLRARLADAVDHLKSEHALTPGLAVVLVGDDPASDVYVRNKGKATLKTGMHSVERRLPADTSQEDLIHLVEELNADPTIHGILVQMPLPDHIDSTTIISTIDPDKDVDGLHPISAGRLAQGLAGLVPCTPQGCVLLIKDVLPDLSGKNALVIGRSILVGKPVAQLLLNENCTVTIAHSRTQNIEQLCKQADILVAAVGRANYVQGSWIKDGAIVIDVGINRQPGENGKDKLIGDVDYEAALPHASAITPVPGGVGPMTVACLLRNTIIAACRQHRIETPEI